MLRLVVPLLLASTISAQAEAPDYSGSYYCRVTAMAGISQDPTSKQWNSARFNTDDVAHTVTVKRTPFDYDGPFGKSATYKISVKNFGSTDPVFGCMYYMGESVDPSNIPLNEDGAGTCSWLGSYYFFDFKNLKMQEMFRGGYMVAGGENTDTPFVAIAKCDKVG